MINCQTHGPRGQRLGVPTLQCGRCGLKHLACVCSSYVTLGIVSICVIYRLFEVIKWWSKDHHYCSGNSLLKELSKLHFRGKNCALFHSYLR